LFVSAKFHRLRCGIFRGDVVTGRHKNCEVAFSLSTESGGATRGENAWAKKRAAFGKFGNPLMSAATIVARDSVPSDALSASVFAASPPVLPSPLAWGGGVKEPTPERTGLSLARLLSALSFALDLTEGQPMGHSVRACLIGSRIGETLGLDAGERADLHLALLLKDAGCSSNAARMFAIFGGDELEAKRDAKITDWRRMSEAVKYALRNTAPQCGIVERTKKLGDLLRLPGRAMDALTEARCTRGAQVATDLGLGPRVASAIYHLDEHWDGQGAPHQTKGNDIPLLSRIACLAQTLEVFVKTFGVARAFEVARARSGTWFDPALVAAAGAFEHDVVWWQEVAVRPRALLEETTPSGLLDTLTDADLDAVCDAFSDIVDAKSPFTGAHSSRVCVYALMMADGFGFDDARRTNLRRAALLHDLGKLAVPNLILDKPARLTEDEFDIIKKHTHYTAEILRPIPTFARITEIAVAHHEKLDGTGYHNGVTANALDLDMRLLAVADIFDAVSAARPYRAAMPLDQALDVLDSDVARGALDADCVAMLKAFV